MAPCSTWSSSSAISRAPSSSTSSFESDGRGPEPRRDRRQSGEPPRGTAYWGGRAWPDRPSGYGRMTRAFVVLLVAAATSIVLAQTPQSPAFHGGTDIVSVYATVADTAGRAVPDLTKDN